MTVFTVVIDRGCGRLILRFYKRKRGEGEPYVLYPSDLRPMLFGETPTVLAVKKLKHWGQVEAHRLDSMDDDILSVTTPLPESGRNAGRDGSKTYHRPDDVPSILADHIDVDLMISRFPVASITSMPEHWRNATKMREILQWRFAHGRDSDDFPIGDLNIPVAEPSLRGKRYEVKEFVSELVVKFVKSLADGIEKDRMVAAK